MEPFASIAPIAAVQADASALAMAVALAGGILIGVGIGAFLYRRARRRPPPAPPPPAPAAASALRACVFLKDAEGRYVACNQTMAEFMGRPAREIVGLTDMELWPADVAASLEGQDAQVFHVVGELQRTMQLPDGHGELFEVLVTKSPGRQLSPSHPAICGIFMILRPIEAPAAPAPPGRR